MDGEKEPPDRGKEDLGEWSEDFEMANAYGNRDIADQQLNNQQQREIAGNNASKKHGDSNEINVSNEENSSLLLSFGNSILERNINNESENVNVVSVGEQRTQDKDSSDSRSQKNSDRLKEILNNKYRITDPAPYYVYVEHCERNLGRLFPITVGHYLFSQKEFKDGIKDIVPVGLNRVKVVAKTYSVANKLVNHPLLSQRNLRSYIPTFFTQKRGIVKMVDTMFDEDYLKANMQTNRKVLEVKRLYRKVVKENGAVEYVKRQMILVTFLGSSIPNNIKINFCNFPVEPYVHPVVSCFSCLRFGHRSNQCKGKPKCTKCAGDHDYNECESDLPFCVHCKSNEHNSTSKKCPAFIRQHNIKKIMAAENITFKEAEFIADNPSYAKVATYNRFALLDNEENFPSLPYPSERKLTLLNKPKINKLQNPSTFNKRKAPSTPPPTSPSTSKPSKRFAFTQPTVVPNPYRDEYMRYKETLLSQITTQFGLFLKQIIPQSIYDHEQFQNNFANFLSTIKNSVDNNIDKNDH